MIGQKPPDPPPAQFASRDWECFLLPVTHLQGFQLLPVHEICRSTLEHVVVPVGQQGGQAVHHELARRKICAVSWRRDRPMPTAITISELRLWSPMSSLQLQRLKEMVAQCECRYLWIDWCCIPQLSGDTMRFINASHEIYSSAQEVAIVSRIKPLPRRDWPALSPSAAQAAVAVVRASAGQVISSAEFSPTFIRIMGQHDAGRALDVSAKLSTESTISTQAESCLAALLRLLQGDEVSYSTFDYFGRAWTLAERLAAFHPSGANSVRMGQVHSAGEALLYGIAGYWRDMRLHDGAYGPEARGSIDRNYLATSVWLRSVDPDDPEVRELWDDCNRMVQLVPGIGGLASEAAALATVCVEWLLHRSTGISDELGLLAAKLLGECVAFAAGAVATAELEEEAGLEWFRKYLYFYAGNIYRASFEQDLVLAVYRSCGLPARETAEEAIDLCRREVFGQAVAGAESSDEPEVARICLEAMRHDDLHAYLLSRGSGKRGLLASDFVAVLPQSEAALAVDARRWHEWLRGSGVITSWWWSRCDQALPGGASDHFDCEQLYCGHVELLDGLSMDEVFRATVAVVYKIHRESDLRWRVVQISLSRRSGRSGGRLSNWRNVNNLRLEALLEPGILGKDGASTHLVEEWNRRCLDGLHGAVHEHWGQCLFARDVAIAS